MLRSASSAKPTSKPSLNGRMVVMCSSVRLAERSPAAVPAKTRWPGAKTASGASVMASTTTSPRMPCALRTRPTIMNSGVVIAVMPGGLRLFRLLGEQVPR
jgi:hypothetical protein